MPAAGRVLLLRPGLQSDLTAVQQNRAQIVTGFRPDYDAFAKQGWAVAAAPDGPFAAAIIFMARARALTHGLVHQAAGAVAAGGPIWVDGQKTDGVDSLLKELRTRATVGDTFAKAHGRSFCFANPGVSAFADWQMQDRIAVPGFVTRPGAFSADGVDPGSALLAAHLPADLKGKGADLGAGWGWLAAQVLARSAVKELHLVEAEAEALAAARQNINDERAQFYWADATNVSLGKAMDFVVMNPPFHQGRAADPALGAAFIRSAARMLQPNGRLWMVANRTLPYEAELVRRFAQVTPVATAHGFKVIMAARPYPPSKTRP